MVSGLTIMPPLNSPCFMFYQRISSCWKLFESSHNYFYDMHFPELLGAEILFSKDGWLLMCRYTGSLFFFNPFTKSKFELPPTPTPSSFLSVCFTSPPPSSDCFIFGIFSPINISKRPRNIPGNISITETHISKIEFGSIKFGDEEWQTGWLDNGAHEFRPSYCPPPLFHNGIYYCLECRSRNIRAFDPTREGESRWMHLGTCGETTAIVEKKEEYEEEEDEEIRESYVVEVQGDIWGVFVRKHSRRVSVEKLDFSEMRWKKLESLGDKCLYVSVAGSFAETCVDSERANKIHFSMFFGESGFVYSSSSGMYHSIDGGFANKAPDMRLAQVALGAWIKPA